MVSKGNWRMTSGMGCAGSKSPMASMRQMINANESINYLILIKVRCRRRINCWPSGSVLTLKAMPTTSTPSRYYSLHSGRSNLRRGLGPSWSGLYLVEIILSKYSQHARLRCRNSQTLSDQGSQSQKTDQVTPKDLKLIIFQGRGERRGWREEWEELFIR